MGSGYKEGRVDAQELSPVKPMGWDLAGATFRKVMLPILRQWRVCPIPGQQLLDASNPEPWGWSGWHSQE